MNGIISKKSHYSCISTIRHVKLCTCSLQQSDILQTKRVLESVNLTLLFFKEVNPQPAQPSELIIAQDMQQKTEVISQPAQLHEQVLYFLLLLL